MTIERAATACLGSLDRRQKREVGAEAARPRVTLWPANAVNRGSIPNQPRQLLTCLRYECTAINLNLVLSHGRRLVAPELYHARWFTLHRGLHRSSNTSLS
jgi:hypothetical protein